MNFDPQADFARIIDGTESVTLLRRGSTPGAEGTLIAHALRRATDAAETTFGNRSEVRKHADSDAHARAADVSWHLPVVELPEAPQLGDVLLDAAGCRWTILEVHDATLHSRWRCTTRELAIANGLDNTVTILKAEYAKGASGAAEATWRVWRTGVRARLQPFDVQVAVEHGASGAKRRYRLLLEENLTLDHTIRIQGADGSQYRILWAAEGPRLGELQTAEVIPL
ncbi:MAG: hypothetical protein JXB10_20700 [Pirellulales bacterium]|nr:hypothetical protein [Pirellulales bacterium]